METSTPDTVSPKLQRVAELARKHQGLTPLAHHIDLDLLKEALKRTRKDGAAGVDGLTAEQYAANLEENLRGLLSRFKADDYRAPPVRRVHIPKGDGSKTRPIGIPTVEDKVLQRAVTMILGAVYEQDFLDCSFGFRPGRSAHDALQKLRADLMSVGGGWVIDADIKSFFDTLDHAHLRDFVGQRIRDGRLRRIIGKWLNAGVMEEGVLQHPDRGTPQGGVISPLLANVYLHYVLDTWFHDEVIPRLRGRAYLTRYADDFVIVCSLQSDAQRIMEVLPKRFARFGLTIHPEKTRVVDFRGGCCDDRAGTGPEGGPGSFDFLGFTHYWGRSRKGAPVVKQATAKTRFNRAVKVIAAWCSEHLHLPVGDQHETLCQKLRGHDAYYGITGNSHALQRLRHAVRRVWRWWLDRRGGKRRMSWDRFARLVTRYPFPPARVVHSVYRA